MTNGEKIKELFPDTKIITQYDNPFGDTFMVFTLNNEHMEVNLDWWYAEYKEPTTKNDLGVDCISRQDVLTEIIRFSTEEGASVECQQLYCDVNNMPSVTPQEPRKGHWKLVQRGKLIDVCCSNCEAVRIKDYAYNYTIDELNKEDINECFGSVEMRFCPHCGVDMREVEE